MTPRRSIAIEQALLAFGISNARVRRQPSFSSVVHRISVNGQRLFLKQHAPQDAARIEMAGKLSERLGRQGLHSARFVPTKDNKLYACREGTLFTLSEPAGVRPLNVLDVGDHDSARRVGDYLARLHDALNSDPLVDLPPRSSLWHDGDHDARTARAREALVSLEPSRQQRTMLDALAVLEQTPAARAPLATVAEREAVVHGDFWPGNVIVGVPPLSDLAVIDLESACRAPLLLDVAHFADLGFHSVAGWRKTREMDVALATTFARAYAAASSMPLEELRALPDLVVAARGCSILWIVERHLDIGPSALDQLVENDRQSVQFVTRIADLWSERLSAVSRPTVTLGS